MLKSICTIVENNKQYLTVNQSIKSIKYYSLRPKKIDIVVYDTCFNVKLVK